jgi:hypothetical protein
MILLEKNHSRIKKMKTVSKSCKWFQEAVSDMREKDKSKIRLPLAGSTLLGIEEFLITRVV